MIDMQDILKNEKKFRYMLLSRLKSDCNYYLGHGERGTRSMWAGNEKDQIQAMKDLYNSFDDEEKPEWLTMDQILEYESKMIPGE